MFASPLLAQPAVRAAPEDLWLSFSFDGTVEPTGGTAAEHTKVIFQRESEAYTPEGEQVSAGAPRFVEGVHGQAVYLGAEATNLLTPELATIAFAEGKPAGIEAVAEATLQQVRGEGQAWHGDSALQVQTSGKQHSGARILLEVPGEAYENGQPGLYVFSCFVKGDVEVTLALRGEVEAGWASEPVAVPASADWTRRSVWVFAAEPESVSVTLTAAGGEAGTFLVDGLQLERKRQNEVGGSPASGFPYGNHFAANPWAPGGQTTLGDVFRATWNHQAAPFPDAEGTLSVWVRTDWPRRDAQTHPVASRSHVFYQLTLQVFNQYSFYRANDAAEKKAAWGEVRVVRPESLTQGQWHLLTATWSNEGQFTRLYFDGELVGEQVSTFSSDSSRNNNLVIGGWAKDALNGALDDLTIYARVLTPELIQRMYRQGPAH